jgi:hypothetical protein
VGTTTIPQEGYNTLRLKSTDMAVFSHHISFHGGIAPENGVLVMWEWSESQMTITGLERSRSAADASREANGAVVACWLR